MEDQKLLEFKEDKVSGKNKCSFAAIEYQNQDVVLLLLEFQNKFYGEYGCASVYGKEPSILIHCDEDNYQSEITFPLEGFEIHSVSMWKDCIKIALHRRINE